MTKFEMASLVYSEDELRHVDFAIPIESQHKVTNDGYSNSLWYVMDYNNNNYFGELTNLAEKLVQKYDSRIMESFNKLN